MDCMGTCPSSATKSTALPSSHACCVLTSCAALGLQVLFMPSGIFQVQQEVTKLMRVVLVEWLLEVAQEFQFGPETLQLAINYMDRCAGAQCVVHVEQGYGQTVPQS